MLVSSIYAHNFKTLLHFNLRLAPFTCLIGLNGAGKSTVLQFVDFLAQQARGDLEGWLDQRGWQAGELDSRLVPQKNIDFKIELSDGEAGAVTWYGSFNTTSLRCSTERVETRTATLQVHDGTYQISEPRESTGAMSVTVARSGRIEFNYQGSILSQLREQTLPESLRHFKRYLTSITPLLLLSPQHLHQRARESRGSLGLGGEKLSAYLYEMDPADRQRLAEQLKHVYPNLFELQPRSTRSGVKRLEIEERYGERKIRTEARHVNDGLLRLTAILAELLGDRPLLLFDEIENGINPELVEFLLRSMLSARQQVLVTTHSPLILNYLSDEQARAGVVYLHRDAGGATRAVHFFSIPSLAKKLTVMGPGEAFVDTNLTELEAEIRAMPSGS